jgi:hypothetical protein
MCVSSLIAAHEEGQVERGDDIEDKVTLIPEVCIKLTPYQYYKTKQDKQWPVRSAVTIVGVKTQINLIINC